MYSTLYELELGEKPHRNNSIQADLDEILRCQEPFHITADLAIQLIRSNCELVEKPERHFEILDPLIQHLESKIFFAGQAEELIFSLLCDHDKIKTLNDAYCSWETALEQMFTWRLCNGSETSLYGYRLNNRFQRLLKRETSMLKGPNPKRALFIGSGPLPISAIWLHRFLDIPVDCVDISLDAIEKSRVLIERIGLNGSINTIHTNSAEYNVSSYDIILIALLAKPKQLILENIHRSASSNCEIICRTSFGLRHAIYEPTTLSRATLDKFCIQDARIVSGNCDDTISSFLLKRIN